MDADSPRLRLSILGIVTFSLFAALFARLWYLQVMATDQGEVEAAANRVRVIQEDAPRGRILDAKGRVIVDNRRSVVVAIDPAKLREMKKEQQQELLLRLARELTRSGAPTKVASLERRLNDPQYSPLLPVPVAIDVPEELQVYLAERADEFPAVSVRRESVRHYPYGSLAAHVVGYTGRISPEEFKARMGTPEVPKDAAKPYQPGSDIGKTGVERVYEDDLRGTPGIRTVEVDVKGRITRTVSYQPPVPGSDLQLSVDIDVQRVTEQELADQLESARNTFTSDGRLARAPAGSAVVLDPDDGSVVAMASYPTFDPTEFVNGISQDRYDQLVAAANPFTNRAIGGLYAPGSTFKLVTAYAALESGLITPDQYVADGGVYRVGTQEFQNAQRRAYGPVDLRRALVVSSDVYFYSLGEQFWLKRDDPQVGDGIQRSARMFGFGLPTGIDLPGELGGVVPDPAWKKQFWASLPDDARSPDGDKWYTGDNINLAIGQGDMLSSPLQIADAYATFLNGGTRYQPQVVQRVLQPQTDVEDPSELDCQPGTEGCRVVRIVDPVVRERLDMPDEIRTPLVEGLRGVIESGEGTAHGAFQGFNLASWPVGGKTGTAQVANKADNALFVGFGPVGDERYVASVVLEEAGFGAEVAAPVVRRLFDVLSGQVPIACVVDPLPGVGPVGAAGTTSSTTSATAGTTATATADDPCDKQAGTAGGTTFGTGGGVVGQTPTATTPVVTVPPTTAYRPVTSLPVPTTAVLPTTVPPTTRANPTTTLRPGGG